MAENAKEMMNRLYKKYGLTSDDVFSHRHYKIITRAGIDKIQAKAGIEVEYDWLYIKRHEGGLDVACKVKGIMGDRIIWTTGEASPENTTQNYPFAMAEKRGMARAVLKLAGLYEEGFFSEDEADDFKKVVANGRKSAVIKTA